MGEEKRKFEAVQKEKVLYKHDESHLGNAKVRISERKLTVV